MIAKKKTAKKKAATQRKKKIDSPLVTAWVTELMDKAHVHDRALDYFMRQHTADTSLGNETAPDLLSVVRYLVARSNAMQQTIEQVEKRERTSAENRVRKLMTPKPLDEMSHVELLEEAYRLKAKANGIRDNY